MPNASTKRLSQFVHNFHSNPADEQTDKHTDPVT